MSTCSIKPHARCLPNPSCAPPSDSSRRQKPVMQSAHPHDYALPRNAPRDSYKKTLLPRRRFMSFRTCLTTRVLPNLPRRRALHAILLLSFYLLLTTDSFTLLWLRWALTGGPARPDPALSLNCPQTNYSLPVAFVIPLIAAQLPRLRWALSRWGDPRFTPCNHPSDEPPTLFFFFDRPLTEPAVASATISIRNFIRAGPVAEAITRCFADVRFTSANLSNVATRNSYMLDPVHNLVHTAGSNAQWEAAFHIFAHTFRHMVFIEPDTWPIRPAWLPAALKETTYGPFWMRGTTMRYVPKFNIGLEPFRSRYQRHLNGNAIYALGDSCFDRYRRLTREAYGNAAFDVAMTQFRLRMANIMTFQEVAHRFQATELIAHIAVTEVIEHELLQKFPRTFLVHGKYMHVKHPGFNFMQYR